METGDNCSVHLTVAMSYSGRQDITAAVQDIAHAVAQGQLLPSQVQAVSSSLRVPEDVPSLKPGTGWNSPCSHCLRLQITPALIASHLSTRQLPEALQVSR